VSFACLNRRFDSCSICSICMLALLGWDLHAQLPRREQRTQIVRFDHSFDHSAVRPLHHHHHSTIRSFSQIFMGGPLSSAIVHRPAIVPPSSSQPTLLYGPGGQDNNLRPQEQGRRRPRLPSCEPFNHHTQHARRKTQDSECTVNCSIIITEYSIHVTLPTLSHQSASRPRSGR
jgi:hypothetical protein